MSDCADKRQAIEHGHGQGRGGRAFTAMAHAFRIMKCRRAGRGEEGKGTMPFVLRLTLSTTRKGTASLAARETD